MQTREELIHIHKRIWNEVREYISHSQGEIDSLLLKIDVFTI